MVLSMRIPMKPNGNDACNTHWRVVTIWGCIKCKQYIIRCVNHSCCVGVHSCLDCENLQTRYSKKQQKHGGTRIVQMRGHGIYLKFHCVKSTDFIQAENTLSQQEISGHLWDAFRSQMIRRFRTCVKVSKSKRLNITPCRSRGMNISEVISNSRHWRIQGAPVAPPQWDPILSFSHTFSLKSTHIRGRPPNGSAPPQPEILDPQLVGY